MSGASAFGAWAAPVAAPSAQHPPNIVVVLLDDIGRDKVGFTGDHPAPAPTPYLDALAARGVVFENAWACPTCSPTRASLLTGQYTTRHGIGRVVRLDDGLHTPLDTNLLTLPDALPDHTSALIGKWHLSDSTSPAAHALECGFDTAVTFVPGNLYTSWTEDVNGAAAHRTGYYPTDVAPLAHRALDGLPEPYFVLYAPFLAHSPFHEPPAGLRPASPSATNVPDLHRAMTEAADTIVGRVLGAVDLECTYVLVIGDNGSPRQTLDGPFAGLRSKSSVYESGVRVPFVVAGPGVARGARCSALVQITDVFATARELAGLGPTTSGAEDSISFVPLLADPSAPGARTYLYAHTFPYPGSPSMTPPSRAIRTRRWKLVERLGYELYDLESDPFESVDLLDGAPTALAVQVRDRLLALMPVFP
ncbi:MAG: sulfatase-like hydrolase/transferase [Planctomycetota bacterium]